MPGVCAKAAVSLRCGWAVVAVVLLVGTGAVAAPAPPSELLKDNLYGTKFVDQRQGWVVGAFGTVYRTSDGGQTWQQQISKTTQQLYDVDFADGDHGWIVGRSGLILHTTDGGETWTPQHSGVDKHLFSLDFADAQHGIIAGDWGTILTTSDGGATWVDHSLADDVILNDVSMADATHGWIAGELGTILVSSDGGATWTKQATGIDKTLFGVFFANPQSGWAVGIDALILHTSDGGQTWQVQNGSTEIRELEQVGFGMAYENPSLYAINVVGDVGIAVGEIGAVFISTDGGSTWKRQDRAANESGPKWFRGVSMVKGTHGAIVGAHGAELRVVDGKIEKPDGGSGAAQTVH